MTNVTEEAEYTEYYYACILTDILRVVQAAIARGHLPHDTKVDFLAVEEKLVNVLGV